MCDVIFLAPYYDLGYSNDRFFKFAKLPSLAAAASIPLDILVDIILTPLP